MQSSRQPTDPENREPQTTPGWGWGERNRDRSRDSRRILAALLWTLVLHGAVVFSIPKAAFTFDGGEARPEPPSYEVALLPPEDEEMRFMQTNPEVPENEPDPTNQFADRNQQAAQEDPDPQSDDSVPTVEGEIEESNQIVEGRLEEPSPPAPPPTPEQAATPPIPPTSSQEGSETEAEASADSARPEIRSIPEEPPTPPAPEFLEQEAVDASGPGSTTGPTGESRERLEDPADRVIPITAPLPVAEDPVEGEIQPPSESREEAAEPTPMNYRPSSEASPPQPRPRPRLEPNVVSAPLMKSNARASRSGVVAVDAEFSEYGEYLQRMVEAVSRAWNGSVDRVELIKERPSRVKVRFTIDSGGNIRNMRVIDKTPNAELLATGLCLDAIQSRAPYDRWTYDMVQVLGTEQEVTFTFYYR